MWYTLVGANQRAGVAEPYRLGGEEEEEAVELVRDADDVHLVDDALEQRISFLGDDALGRDGACRLARRPVARADATDD